MNTLLIVAWICAGVALGIAIESARHHHASPAAIVIAALILALTIDRLHRRWIRAAMRGQDMGRHAGARKTKAAPPETPAITAPTRKAIAA